MHKIQIIFSNLSWWNLVLKKYLILTGTMLVFIVKYITQFGNIYIPQFLIKFYPFWSLI